VTTSAPPLTLDHVIIGVSDLEGASRELGRTLGRRASWRGRHPTYGTANVLFRLDNAYLELLAPDPDADETTAWTNSLGRFLRERGDGLFSIAMASADAAASAAAARAGGLVADDPLEGEGVDLDTGAVRRWTNARIAPETTRGTRSFFIQHLTPPEALPPAPAAGEQATVTSVLGVSIESGESEGARRMWRTVFGLPESGFDGGHRYDLGNAALILWPGGGEPDNPDRYQRLILGVPTLSRLADRFDREGIDFEQGLYPEGDGILVRCCGADLLFLESL
jgi:hypothetical protein